MSPSNPVLDESGGHAATFNLVPSAGLEDLYDYDLGRSAGRVDFDADPTYPPRAEVEDLTEVAVPKVEVVEDSDMKQRDRVHVVALDDNLDDAPDPLSPRDSPLHVIEPTPHQPAGI